MSTKLYGAKCHICSHLTGSTHEVEPGPWPMTGMQCADCGFCQQDIVTRVLREDESIGLFDPAVRRAVDDLLSGRANPLIDQLKASFGETCEWRGRKWSVADMQRDESEYGVHWHLTLVRVMTNPPEA